MRENLGQFSLLVLVNAFVGGMIGLERTVVPLIGTDEFGISSATVVFSFISAFGVVKAFVNLASGLLADRFTRKCVLVAGWIVGLPVPFMLGYGPAWSWIIAANVLLGISQGLAWSMTVNMKIDLVGPRNRGLAMGLNEAAGYGMVGLTALLTGYVAARYGLRPEPFYIGIAYAVLGLLLSIFLVRDTRPHAQLEASRLTAPDRKDKASLPRVFADTSWRDRTLFSVSQAGMVNNLNDGMSSGPGDRDGSSGTGTSRSPRRGTRTSGSRGIPVPRSAVGRFAGLPLSDARAGLKTCSKSVTREIRARYERVRGRVPR